MNINNLDSDSSHAQLQNSQEDLRRLFRIMAEFSEGFVSTHRLNKQDRLNY